jgi:hypothetical protein
VRKIQILKLYSPNQSYKGNFPKMAKRIMLNDCFS